VILFVMLAGYLPFDDPNMNALFNKIERGEFRMSRSFSEPVRDLISRMLVVDPVKRISVEDIIRHPWFQVDFNPLLLNYGDITVTSQQIATAMPARPLHHADGASRCGEDAFGMVSWILGRHFTHVTDGELGMASGVLYHILFADTAARTRLQVEKALWALRICPRAEGSHLLGSVNGRHGSLAFEVEVLPTCVASLSLIGIRKIQGERSVMVEFRQVLSGMLGHGVRS
jgi:hypothetical protein